VDKSPFIPSLLITILFLSFIIFLYYIIPIDGFAPHPTHVMKPELQRYSWLRAPAIILILLYYIIPVDDFEPQPAKLYYSILATIAECLWCTVPPCQTLHHPTLTVERVSWNDNQALSPVRFFQSVTFHYNRTSVEMTDIGAADA
jgi:hypothetical protein